MSIMWGIEIAQLYMWLLLLIARLWPLRQAKFHTLGWPNVLAPQPILVLCWLEKISAESNEQQQQQQNRMKNWFKGRNNNSNMLCEINNGGHFNLPQPLLTMKKKICIPQQNNKKIQRNLSRYTDEIWTHANNNNNKKWYCHCNFRFNIHLW